MPVFARDLPPETRELLLRQLQTQLGGGEYFRLVNLYGEDGLLDLALAQMAQQPTPKLATQMTPTSPQKRAVTSTEVGAAIWWFVVYTLIVLVGMGIQAGFLPPLAEGTEPDTWRILDWAWYWKIVVGMLGFVLDCLLFGRVLTGHWDAHSTDTDSNFVLGAINWLASTEVGGWIILLVGLARFIIGPTLLIWGIVDVFR
jgi:hypothetical protein